MKVGPGPKQSGVGISFANLRDVLNLNTITRRLLLCQELQQHCMHNVAKYFEYIKKSTLSAPKTS